VALSLPFRNALPSATVLIILSMALCMDASKRYFKNGPAVLK
jgi:hypothetical protein